MDISNTQETADIPTRSTQKKLLPKVSKDLKILGLEPIWQSALDHGYDVVELIGSGSYGTVVKASRNGKKVAIKHVVVEGLQYTLVKTLRELHIMRYLKNRSTKKHGMDMFFAGLTDVFGSTEEVEAGAEAIENLFIVMPIADGSLEALMSSYKIDRSSVKVILYNLLCAI